MDSRRERLAKNEAIFREVNEQIESLNRGIAAITDQTMQVVCECGDLRCIDQLLMTVEDYERVRADARRFVVLPGHERPDVEDVVETALGYLVVQKHEGDPALVARETDPRHD